MLKTVEKINPSAIFRSVTPLLSIALLVMSIQPFLWAWRWWDIKICQEKVTIAQLEKKIRSIKDADVPQFFTPVEDEEVEIQQPVKKKKGWW